MPDKEIDAMSAVAGALGDLDEDARNRVLRWAADRFSANIGSVGPRPAVAPDGPDSTEEVTEKEISAEAPAYELFAELFNAAAPKTNEDKALVAGYWFQVLKGQDNFKSADLQRELKNLGHAVPNITRALDGNIKKKPARVLQLKKAGASKQAQKTYKLSHEGKMYVQRMIGASA